MAIDNDELKDHIVDELRQLRSELTDSITDLHGRLDKQDLNHAAEYLREFGYFLERNPNFMQRQKMMEEQRQEKEVVKQYFARVLHLRNWRHNISLIGVGVATGFLFALGNALFGPLGPAWETFHKTIEHMINGK